MKKLLLIIMTFSFFADMYSQNQSETKKAIKDVCITWRYLKGFSKQIPCFQSNGLC